MRYARPPPQHTCSPQNCRRAHVRSATAGVARASSEKKLEKAFGYFSYPRNWQHHALVQIRQRPVLHRPPRPQTQWRRPASDHQRHQPANRGCRWVVPVPRCSCALRSAVCGREARMYCLHPQAAHFRLAAANGSLRRLGLLVRDNILKNTSTVRMRSLASAPKRPTRCSTSTGAFILTSCLQHSATRPPSSSNFSESDRPRPPEPTRWMGTGACGRTRLCWRVSVWRAVVHEQGSQACHAPFLWKWRPRHHLPLAPLRAAQQKLG